MEEGRRQTAEEKGRLSTTVAEEVQPREDQTLGQLLVEGCATVEVSEKLMATMYLSRDVVHGFYCPSWDYNSKNFKTSYFGPSWCGYQVSWSSIQWIPLN